MSIRIGERRERKWDARAGRAPRSHEVLIGGAPFVALTPQHQMTGSELYNTNSRNTPEVMRICFATTPA
jgi:hypothetical protein